MTVIDEIRSRLRPRSQGSGVHDGRSGYRGERNGGEDGNRRNANDGGVGRSANGNGRDGKGGGRNRNRDRGRRNIFGFRRRRRTRRVRKLRALLLIGTFLALAGVSMVFGMLTSIASDLPQLENRVQFSSTTDSYLYDINGKPIGVLAPPTATKIVTWKQMSANMNMVNAIVSVEDKRFWHSSGVDVRSLGRALISDVTGHATEGASTIPEEFVKNVLNEEDNRTVFEKLREAGMAFQLVHHWPRWKIMTEYLNSIYFGNGATGIEAAARTYFGKDYGYDASNPSSEPKSACGDPDTQDPNRKECVEMLNPEQAAVLAGLVANPTAFDPILHPGASRQRCQLVLQNLYAQHYITYAQYQEYYSCPLPTASQIETPQEPSTAPYYVSWVRPLVIRALEKEGLSPSEAQYEAYYGGLKITLALNLKMQTDAQAAVNEEFPPGEDGPTASLVAINNSNGEVEAMVSGDGDYQASPFNLATLGYRQPGSSFKMFTLAAALSRGVAGIDSIFDSEQINIPYDTPQGWSIFHVHNFDNAYDGDVTLATATKTSDNSVFAQLGWKVGTKYVKSYAQLMGIRSSIDTFPAMILGGLTQGVSALDMAHAYETAATGGLKIYNNVLGDVNYGPIGIQQISGCKPCKHRTITNDSSTMKSKRVLSPTVAAEIHTLLEGPVSAGGTGTRANIEGANVVGKTGTTSNYADAWFVGWTPSTTVAVWVGYANSDKPMETAFDGEPVEGGTYPAIIFHNFMEDALQILAAKSGTTSTTSTVQETASNSGASNSSSSNSNSYTSSSSSSSTSSASQGNQGTSGTSTAGSTPSGGGTGKTGASGGSGNSGGASGSGTGGSSSSGGGGL